MVNKELEIIPFHLLSHIGKPYGLEKARFSGINCESIKIKVFARGNEL